MTLRQPVRVYCAILACQHTDGIVSIPRGDCLLRCASFNQDLLCITVDGFHSWEASLRVLLLSKAPLVPRIFCSTDHVLLVSIPLPVLGSDRNPTDEPRRCAYFRLPHCISVPSNTPSRPLSTSQANTGAYPQFTWLNFRLVSRQPLDRSPKRPNLRSLGKG
ncbi:hypothetical protein BR93DRAFT_921698 [Coniochaeta sp. PMI_546]|nr:hypothetical protein BR93DRAFT_921698 [Coniochaeta sp. PMI_546]